MAFDDSDTCKIIQEDCEEDNRRPLKDIKEGLPKPFTFFTTVAVTRWIIKAYGYVAKKKKAMKNALCNSPLFRQSSECSSVVDQLSNACSTQTPLWTLEDCPPGYQRRMVKKEIIDSKLIRSEFESDDRLICAWIISGFVADRRSQRWKDAAKENEKTVQ